MVKLIKKEYYPISDRIGLRLDIDNNNISSMNTYCWDVKL